MKRKRLINDNWTEEDVAFLSKLGIKAKVGYMKFVLDEDERYHTIREHFEEKWDFMVWARDKLFYEYSKEEYNTAEYYALAGFYGCGYPQPEDDFKAVSFNSEKICYGCGCGRIQTNDLRVNKVSKHGFWTFFSWLIDEFFVSEKVYNEVFAPYGIAKRDVIKGGKKLEGVFQLVIPVIDECLNLSDRLHWKCPKCGEIKYRLAHRAYPFFPLHEHPLPGIYKTKENFDFGEGDHQAERTIIISKEVAEKLIKSKDIKQDWLVPCRKDYKEFILKNKDL